MKGEELKACEGMRQAVAEGGGGMPAPVARPSCEERAGLTVPPSAGRGRDPHVVGEGPI